MDLRRMSFDALGQTRFETKSLCVEKRKKV